MSECYTRLLLIFLLGHEGKEIGKANGYRLVQLEELAYGSVLKLGGREVLVSPLA